MQTNGPLEPRPSELDPSRVFEIIGACEPMTVRGIRRALRTIKVVVSGTGGRPRVDLDAFVVVI